MQDNHQGDEKVVPFKTDRRFVTLSPIIDSWKGKQFEHNPAFAGEEPANNIGLLPDSGEVPDKQFRKFPESGRVVGKGGKKGVRNG